MKSKARCTSPDEVPTSRHLLRWLFTGAMALHSLAQAEVERSYSVDAGDAATSLRQFVEQSGEQVVYFVGNVRGVVTHSVAGTFSARNALEDMLAGTELVVEQDERTGAFAVRRKTAHANDNPIRGRLIALFDGASLSGWHSLGSPGAVGWKTENGLLAWQSRAGDLATDRDFGNFELEFEWKISSGGRGKVAFRANPNSSDPALRTGVEYAFADPFPTALPAGQWNVSRIVARNSRVECWLNGTRVKSTLIGSSNREATGAQDQPALRSTETPAAIGAVVLRDEGTPIWFRRIVLRPLDPAP
jgi:hypothetical protein